MFRRFQISYIKDPVLIKVISLSLILFFIFLSDAILSYWVPNFLDMTLVDTTKVGLVLGFSSVIGLLADLVIPQLIRGVTVRKLVFLSILASFVFSFTLLTSTWAPFILILLTSMAVWGIYYELLGFAQQQFVADATPLRFHSAAWGILGVFKSLSYFLGPILASGFLDMGERVPLYAALFFALISFLILTLHKGGHDRPLDIDMSQVNIFREIEHWRVLFVHVWPVLIMSLMMGVIDATFWTVGPILSEKLASESWLGSMFVSIYVLPSLFMGFVVAKWGVYKGKKKMAEKFLLLSGILFTLLTIGESIVWQSVIVFIASSASAVSYPLIDGVYSDITSRMGRERKHLIGLSNSTVSIAYIFGPPLSGFISQFFGNEQTFVVLGISLALISGVLLFVTPKKLLLPQEEISEWKD